MWLNSIDDKGCVSKVYSLIADIDFDLSCPN